MREFRAALATGPADRPRRIATSARATSSPAIKAEAKKQALAALEIAPSFERAQELLLNAVSGDERNRRSTAVSDCWAQSCGSVAASRH